MEAWTICDSVHKDIPPSQWELSTSQQNCFKRHDTPPFTADATTAPGTALFQHWIRSSYKKDETTSSSWDPWKDFPNETTMKLYPDISDDDAARDYYTLWYATTVNVPEDDGHRGHLTLHGVNYQPIVYFDGKMLQPYTVYSEDDAADNNHDTGGMFLRRHYDLGLSNNLKQSSSSPSSLEILVLPPPFVGRPCKESCTTSDCQGGDHNIAKSGAIMQCTAGWDWISPTPDRNTGIWDEVEVEWTLGNVKIHDIWVKTSNIVVENESEYNEASTALPLGDDVTVSAWINLTVTATYHTTGNQAIGGEISYWIMPYSNLLSTSPEQLESSALASGTIYNVTIEQQVADYHLGTIHIPKAKLWWPHTHGAQPLYTVHFLFRSSGSGSYHCHAHDTFGIRTVSSETGGASKSFTLKINGHPIFLAGGNWITSDQFLRFSNSYKRYFNELTLLVNAGFNSVRVWGGGITETRQFYQAADEVGMLIYQEFWMTGDNNGRFAGDYDWPNDHVSYTNNVRDVVRKLRNHPSLAFFGGGNELYPTNKSPPRDIEEQIRSCVGVYDGTRPYMTSSVTEVGDPFDPARSLGPRDGPYGIQREDDFFDRNPGFTSPLLSLEELAHNVSIHDIKNKLAPGRNIGFQAEIGSVSHPELESLKRFLSSDALISFPRCGVTSCSQVDQEWNYLRWLSFTEEVSGLDRICQFQYPPVNDIDTLMDSIEDYSWAAQFAQYNQYNSLVQGYSHRIFDWHSAFYIWKTSSPSPTLRGSLYDWYMATNGGYWGAHAGLSGGGPIRLIFNRRDWTLHVVNTLPKAFFGTAVRWTAHSLNGTRVGGNTIPIPDRLNGNHVTHLEYKLPWIQGDQAVMPELQNILLYRIEVLYQDHEVGSSIKKARNDYYLTDPSFGSHSQSRYALLGAYRKVFPRVRLEVACNADDDSMDISCTIVHSQQETVAVMTRVTLVLDSSMPDGTDNRILPSFYSQNYITLLHGESYNVNINTTTEHKRTWICLPDGYIGVGTTERGGFFLMVSVDGWNVEYSTTSVHCHGQNFLGLS